MIVTLTPNPALDLTYHLDRFTLGASQRVPPAQMRAGGKGINVARVLHAQGRPTCVLAPVGGVTGTMVTADLDSAGLPHSLLPVAAPTRTTVAISTPEQTTNLNETGTALRRGDWDRLIDLLAETLADAESAVLVCSGSTPPDTPPDALARAVETAHAHGARCVVDTSGPQLIAAADAGADVLKPNHHELLAVIEQPDGDVVAAARTLARRSGPHAVVYASLGPDGLLRVPAAGPVLHARLGRVLTGNTTGAGDAAVAAIAADLADEASGSTALPDPVQTVRTATSWSAAAVLHPLAGSITDPDPLLQDITVTEITDEED